MSGFDLKDKKVWVAGHNGMVGQAIIRRLAPENTANILTVSRKDVDLRDQAAVDAWMSANRPDAVFLAAAKVGGIYANDTYPADFLYDNLMIATNIIHAAHKTDVEKLLFLGSSCIYPKISPQPMPESALLTGPLEPTNEWYAVAKIAGIKLCQAYRAQHDRDFISAMPTNLYGPGDNFHPMNSHVLPALLRKAHEAKTSGETSMSVWGSGKPMREFMHVDDCADALVFIMKNYSAHEHINVGSSDEITIAELAKTIMKTTGYDGALTFDSSKPDGTMRKLMDGARLKALGWSPSISLQNGLAETYQWYLKHGI